MRDLKNYKVQAPAAVTLAGRHVTLEPYEREKHLEVLWQALGGAEGINELLTYFPQEAFSEPGSFGGWLDAAARDFGWVTLVFRDNNSKQIVGMASYMRPDPKSGVVEVGSVAHSPQVQRSPLTTEVHYLMARHVFEDLGYRRYEWKCHNENAPSKRSAIRYGFTFEGIFRQHMISKGVNRDTAWFSMIDGEWPLLKQAFEAWLAPENFDEQGGQRRRLEDIRTERSKGAAA